MRTSPGHERERVVVKLVDYVIAAAVIAGALTLLTANNGRLNADPLPQPARAAVKACTERPWPYLNCVGTRFGNPHIRLVTTERFAR
jgi:hypothetical protein